MASKPKVTTHHRYRCKVCGKIDRRGRTVAHILKKHVSLDRVPCSCSLCNFRCTEKKDLHRHLDCYARHVEEVTRTGLSDLTQVLNQSTDPVQVEDFMVDLDSCKTTSKVAEDTSIFESQENLDPLLPDWLSDLACEKVPTPTRVVHLSPKKTPLQPVLRQPTSDPSFATVNIDELVSPAQTSFLSELFNSPLCTATPTAGHQPTFQPPRQVNATPLRPGQVVTSQPAEQLTLALPHPRVSAPSRSQTPLQDEPVNILPVLLEVDGSDPLLSEKEDPPPAKRQKTSDRHRPEPEGSTEVKLHQDSILAIVNALTQGNRVMVDAMKDQTEKMRNLDRTMRCVLDELRSIQHGIQAIVRNTRPQSTPRVQSTVTVPSPRDRHKSRKHDRRN